MDEELPEGWADARLGDITMKVGSGATPRGGSESYKKTGTPLIRSQNVYFEGFRDEGLAFLDAAQAKALDEATVRPKDVLLNITGASIGRVALAPERMAAARVNQHVCIIRFCAPLSPELISMYIASPAVQSFINAEEYGVTRQALTKGQILDFSIPIPPLAEQERIVAKVEELLAHVKAVRECLAKVPTILKRFRQSVLATACSGQLTADWRDEQRHQESSAQMLNSLLALRAKRWHECTATRYKPPVAPEDGWADDVPETWALASMDQLTVTITSGSRDWSRFYGGGTGTFIMAQNVRPGYLDLGFRQAVDPPPKDRDRLRSQVSKGDLLVTIVGANTGDVCPVLEDLPEHYVCQSVALMRPTDPALCAYLNLWLNSLKHGRGQYEHYIYGEGRPHLSFDHLRMTAVAIPSLPEQHEIVRRVEALFKLADAIEKCVAIATARTEKITQSILAKAFRGELVPTEAALARAENRPYEPATVLLERIRQQRAAAPKPARRTPRPAPARK